MAKPFFTKNGRPNILCSKCFRGLTGFDKRNRHTCARRVLRNLLKLLGKD